MIIGGRKGFGRGSTIAGVLLATVSVNVLAWPTAALAQGAHSEAVHNFNIPAQALDDALMDFGSQSGLQVSIDAADLQGRKSDGVRGRMTTREALARLLSASGFSYRIDGNVVTLARAPQASTDGSITLGSLKVEGENLATSAETSAQRDARQKDAIYDQDISSVYVTGEEIDRYKGTNASDVLKGMVNVFSGDARNGGAIDPSIRGIQGPGRVPVIIDGTEQALVVYRGYNGANNRSYIDPSLISGMQVLKGPVSTRGINGSTGGAVVIDTLGVNDILKPGEKFGVELKLEGGNNSTNPRWPTLLTGQDYTTVSGFLCSGGSPSYPYCDPSLRVNLRTQDDNESFSAGDRAIRIAAAGRIGDIDLFGAYAFRERGNYFAGTTGAGYYQQADLEPSAATYVRILGLHYEPGNEVPNTSSELESILLKATWNIASDQSLQFGFRDTRAEYGEIMPSRIMTSIDGYTFGNVQWPASKVHTQAYNAEYKWQPDSRWIDFKATAWLTDTVSDTYSSGGFPNVATTTDPIIVNNAISNARNDRFGFTASNQFNLSSKLSFLLEGNWQHEKLRSDDDYLLSTKVAGWRTYPREGRREEYRINLSGEWKPVKFIKFNAGLAYSGYWAKDDFLTKLLAANGGSISQIATTGNTTSYQTTEYGLEAYEAYLRATYTNENLIQRRLTSYAANPTTFTLTHAGADWLPDANGDYHRADNICINGFLDTVANYNGTCRITNIQEYITISESKRKSGSGWAPTVSATVYLSDHSRAYARYAEALRWPSMFESTIGFSSSINLFQDLKPERIKSWEVAFIQDLRPLFGLRGEGQRADIKLTWYHNTTHNVIERDTHLMFSNLDKQTIAGFELQARFDNGRFFTDISAGHMTKNQVCDESVAVQIDVGQYRVPDCVKYGFMAGFLLTQATPETSVNWNVGGRFFDRRLEVGGRLIWYSGYDNPQLTEWTAGGVGGWILNTPYTWGEIITVDAYARFRINERFTAELSGTNLNDRYYMDPLSRSMLPAPGRTVRMSLTGRF